MAEDAMAIVCGLILSDNRHNKNKRCWIKEWRQQLFLLYYDTEMEVSCSVLMFTITLREMGTK